MLLYENLLRTSTTRPDLKSVYEKLPNAVVVNVQNVADYYYQEEEVRLWTETDFPNIAPPWPAAFYEYQNRTGLGTFRHGALVSALAIDFSKYTPDSKLLEEYAKKIFAYNRGASEPEPDRVWDNFSESIKNASLRDAEESILRIKVKGIRWELSIWTFYSKQDSAPCPLFHYEVPVCGDGSLALEYYSSDQPYRTVALSESARFFSNLSSTAAYCDAHASLLAMSFTHCKNVRITETSPLAKTARSFHKKYRIPKATYCTLEIDPMRKILDASVNGDPHKVRQALHICRGHFKDFTENGLFGRYKGVYWWNMHVKGDAINGARVKDYNILAKR